MAIITGFKSGKSYTFKNLTTEKMLNLYGGRTDKGTNVCQYTADGSDDQKWTFLGDKLYAYGSSTKCLDKFTSSGSAKNNNADIWDNDDDKNQIIEISQLNAGSPYVTIKLKQGGYYLTAYTGKDYPGDRNMNLTANTDAGKTPTSAGNVYWASNGKGACTWIANEVGTSTGEETSHFPSKQYLVAPYDNTGITTAYDEECDMIKEAKKEDKKVCAMYPYRVHYGIDLIGKDLNNQSNRNIKASGKGTVLSIRNNTTDNTGTYLGHTILIRYPNSAYDTGVSKRDVYFLYCHLNSIKVRVGDIVTPQTVIGEAGNTGKGADQVHLHLEAYTCEITTSASESGGTAKYCVNPLDYLFKSNSATATVGTRNIMPDCDAPFSGSAYCDGNKSGCTHDNRLYFYNLEKIRNLPMFSEPLN